MEPYNPRLKKAVLDVVDNQINQKNPPIAAETFERLIRAGYSRQAAKVKIAAAVLGQIYDILHDNKPFDEVKYEEALKSIK